MQLGSALDGLGSLPLGSALDGYGDLPLGAALSGIGSLSIGSALNGYGSLPIDSALTATAVCHLIRRLAAVAACRSARRSNGYRSLLLGSELDCLGYFGSLPLGMTLDMVFSSMPLDSVLDVYGSLPQGSALTASGACRWDRRSTATAA